MRMKRNNKNNIFTMLKKFSPKLSVLVIALSIFVGVIEFLVLIMELILIEISGSAHKTNFWMLLGVFLFFSMGVRCMHIFIMHVCKENTRRVCTDGKNKFLKAASNLSLSEIEDKKIQEELANCNYMFENTEVIINGLSERISNCVFLGGAIIFISYDKIFFGIIFVVFTLVAFVLQKKNAEFTSTFWTQYMSNAKKFNVLSDIMINREYAEERKMFDTSIPLNSEFEREFDCARTINRENGKKRLLFDLCVEIVNKLLIVVLIIMWIGMLYYGKFSIGHFIILVEIAFIAQHIISSELSKQNKFDEYSLLVKQFCFFEEKFSKKGNPSLEDIHGDDICIEFLDVSFTYPNSEEESLKNFSHTFKKGNTYLVVGKNGSGKSTLLKLMMGLYKTDEGQILINGRNIMQYSVKALSEIFSVVFQTPNKYPLAIADNILFTEDKNKKSVLCAWEEQVSVVKYIKSLSRGWDTRVGELEKNNTDLSGGQWQQIAFLRASVRNAPVKIYDEPTAGMDAIIEKQINKLIFDERKNKLQIIVSHRLNFTHEVDKILVLDEGRLVEVGNHDELVRKRGVYYEIFQTQKEFYI